MARRRGHIQEGEDEERKRVAMHRFDALVALCESHSLPAPDAARLFRRSLEALRQLRSVHRRRRNGGRNRGRAQGDERRSAHPASAFATGHLIALLRGDRTDKVAAHGHDRLPPSGSARTERRNTGRAVFRQLYAAGCLDMDIVRYGRWLLTDAGRRVLRGEETFEIARRCGARPPREAGEETGSDACRAGGRRSLRGAQGAAARDRREAGRPRLCRVRRPHADRDGRAQAAHPATRWAGCTESARPNSRATPTPFLAVVAEHER